MGAKVKKIEIIDDKIIDSETHSKEFQMPCNHTYDFR
jgi:hypothetical protein